MSKIGWRGSETYYSVLEQLSTLTVQLCMQKDTNVRIDCVGDLLGDPTEPSQSSLYECT